jgi:hypothetical protein
MSVAAALDLQERIDQAFAKILSTEVGRSVCTHILGGDVDAFVTHLGVSSAAAKRMAKQCTSQGVHPWVLATSYADIQKFSFNSAPRKYVITTAPFVPMVESWTDPYSNTTSFFERQSALTESRLVQLLAHEMAVYFDSKANPAHPEAQKVPALRDLGLTSPRGIHPLVAISDPLVAHTLTFVRALQVEFAIVDELVQRGELTPTPDYNNVYLRFVTSKACSDACLRNLILTMRPNYLPVALPLLSFAAHFRGLMTKELMSFNPGWSEQKWEQFQLVFNRYPVEFLTKQFNPADALAFRAQHLFDSFSLQSPEFKTVADFFENDLWPLEKGAIFNSSTGTSQSLLEFMKEPLLSGYNILLSSGPRVRLNIGNME